MRNIGPRRCEHWGAGDRSVPELVLPVPEWPPDPETVGTHHEGVPPGLHRDRNARHRRSRSARGGWHNAGFDADRVRRLRAWSWSRATNPWQPRNATSLPRAPKPGAPQH